MDAINHIFTAGLPWPEFLIALAAGAVIYLFFTYTVVSNGEESALDIYVPVPEQCKPNWHGKLLEEPSVKVAMKSVQEKEEYSC